MDPAQGDAKSEDEHMKTSPKKDDKAVDEDAEKAQSTLGNKAEADKARSSSSSTSSNDSSDDDFFQLDPAEFNKSLSSNELKTTHSGPAATATNPNGFLSLIDDDCVLPSPQPVGRQFSSPPIQMMERSDVPDPNRIPSSIFTRTKSITPMEWSVASNESLFSIHVGNASFSRDHSFLMGRSGEFSPYIGSSPESHQQLPCVPGSLGNGAEQELDEPSSAREANAKAMKNVAQTKEEGHPLKGQQLAEASTFSISLSRRSDASASSFQSFAFPILTGEGRTSSAKAGETTGETVHPEKPQQPPPETESPKAAPPAAQRRWFPSFSCCSSCC
ncbi:hypothetical protein Cni_G24932 [Canna indica]|uniref:Uncharacterized protein n=1 Tax=Canna indica TaxID=4628 RepID=A0AAQ3KWY3_9LILI|nr:hypothetical protein Cni_G24932 [Canna indica]